MRWLVAHQFGTTMASMFLRRNSMLKDHWAFAYSKLWKTLPVASLVFRIFSASFLLSSAFLPSIKCCIVRRTSSRGSYFPSLEFTLAMSFANQCILWQYLNWKLFGSTLKWTFDYSFAYFTHSSRNWSTEVGKTLRRKKPGHGMKKVRWTNGLDWLTTNGLIRSSSVSTPSFSNIRAPYWGRSWFGRSKVLKI